MDSMGKDQWFISRCPDTIEQHAAHVYIWYCRKLRRNHFCSEKDSLNCDEKKSKRLNWDEKKAKSTSYSISNRSKPQNGTELFEPLCKHSDSRARRWEQLLRSAKWGICDHFWQLWRLIGIAHLTSMGHDGKHSLLFWCSKSWPQLSFQVRKVSSSQAGRLRRDLWCLSSSPRWTAFLQSVSFSSCPSRKKPNPGCTVDIKCSEKVSTPHENSNSILCMLINKKNLYN